MNPKEFSYFASDIHPNLRVGLPYLPITLQNKSHSVSVSALVDSGSMVNILPFDVGISLGLDWNSQTFSLPSLVGNLEGLPVFAVLLEGLVEPFPRIPLAFAWTSSNSVPVILGQSNFFSEFDVSFFGSRNSFQVLPKQGRRNPESK